MEHVCFIFDFLEEISMSPLRCLAYIRTSYGFNGLVVRCERFHKFVLAIVKVGDKLGIDDFVASFLDKQLQFTDGIYLLIQNSLLGMIPWRDIMITILTQ